MPKHQCPHPSGHFPLVLPFFFDAHRLRERELKRSHYKAFSNIKLRLGFSNIQGPKPFDLWLTSSKALIYYYN